jgi:hypothetical protein
MLTNNHDLSFITTIGVLILLGSLVIDVCCAIAYLAGHAF